MAKVKVRVLYPTAFAALGLASDDDEVSVEESEAADLVAQGYAEVVKPKTTKKAD